MGELENLKLLELTNCYSLQRISSSMIRKLSKLEELHVGVFEEWDEGTGNASLMDIHKTYLPNLAILSLTYRTKIPNDFSFSNLIGYHIHFCDCEYPRFKTRLRHSMARTMCIVPNVGIVNACKDFFNNVYDLCLECNSENFRNLMPDMSQTGFQELSRLVIYGCEMECVISSSMQENQEKNSFSNLAELEIGATSLIEIYEGQPPHGFLENLQRVTVVGCDRMIIIFPPKLFQGMQKLGSVMIEDCENLQEVFSLEGLDEANKDCLSRLTKLELYSLYALTSIWKGPTNLVNLRSLTHLTIYYCKSLKYVFTVSLAQSLLHLKELDLHDCDEVEFIIAEKEEGQEIVSETCTQQFCLHNLKTVKIEKYNKLKYVFPVAWARGLPNLTEMYIKACNQLSSMYGIEAQADTGDDVEEIVFTKLFNIYLEELPSLAAFCPRGYNFVFSSLQKLTVKECLQMTTSFVAAPDASVRAKPEPKAQALSQDSETGKATIQVIFGPRSADNISEWICSEGKWTPKTDCEKRQREEKL